MNEGYGEINGKSFPPDVSGFYNPLIEWFEDFKTKGKNEFVLNFRFEYVNTASLKLLMDVMYKIEEVQEAGKEININWHYPDDDPEMREIGEEFERVLKLKFEYISYRKIY